MSETNDQEENQEQKTNASESPINKGIEFMRLRRVNTQVRSNPQEIMPKGGKQMDIATGLALSTVIGIGGLLIGFLFGWFSNVYYDNLIETIRSVGDEEYEEEMNLTPHPEMIDSDGNLIPFQLAKLISVEFQPSDAFDMDPFPDADDD
jgi:hypothetical protein